MNRQEKRDEARSMRKNMTHAESTLWSKIRRNQIGYKVRSQALVQGYIADFYIPSVDMVIEVDGLIHLKQKAYDDARDGHILKVGVRTIRFTNSEILSNVDACIEEIKKAASEYEGKGYSYANHKHRMFIKKQIKREPSTIGKGIADYLNNNPNVFISFSG